MSWWRCAGDAVSPPSWWKCVLCNTTRNAVFGYGHRSVTGLVGWAHKHAALFPALAPHFHVPHAVLLNFKSIPPELPCTSADAAGWGAHRHSAKYLSSRALLCGGRPAGAEREQLGNVGGLLLKRSLPPSPNNPTQRSAADGIRSLISEIMGFRYLGILPNSHRMAHTDILCRVQLCHMAKRNTAV